MTKLAGPLTSNARVGIAKKASDPRMTGTQTGSLEDVARSPISWRISSFCAGTGECVAIAQLPAGRVAMRDTKNPSGPALTFSNAEWAAFVAQARAGEFDR